MGLASYLWHLKSYLIEKTRLKDTRLKDTRLEKTCLENNTATSTQREPECISSSSDMQSHARIQPLNTRFKGQIVGFATKVFSI